MEDDDKQLTDEQEWDAALTDFKESKGIDDGGSEEEEQEQLTDEQKADKKKADDAAEAKRVADEAEAEKAKGETPEETKARHDQDAADKKAADEAAAAMPRYNEAAANARKTQREIQQDRDDYRTDLKEKLYPDLKNELEDSEGQPIRTVADLMRLENPSTGKAFTENEAGLFLIQAQKHLANQNADAEKRIEDIADVLITVRDESLAVRQKWGPLLAEMEKVQPGFAATLRDKFKKQLETDSESGIITGFKMGPEEFYDTALGGYELAAQQLQAKDEELAQSQQKQQETETKLNRSRNKADRSDVTSGGKVDNKTDDDKEWDEAIGEVFGDRIKSKKK